MLGGNKKGYGGEMRYCVTCLSPETRPRITFDDTGKCNACQWAETKKSIDWDGKRNDLKQLCNIYRRNDYWDVIVPCSGGKDGSYVAWKLKHEFDMHPLCITFAPPMPTQIGQENLRNFIASGFEHIQINPNPQIYRALNKKGFIEQGRPKLGFVVGISTAITRMAISMKIPFVMWGEEGESEYGGSMEQINKDKIDRDYLTNFYYSGHDPEEYLRDFSQQDLLWWSLPTQDEMNMANLYQTHWSKFEPWDDQLHRDLVIEKCGLRTEQQLGTFTDYAQLDDILQDFHAYMMFLKFGFGRATSDVNLAIRAGRITRDEGLGIVNWEDGVFPARYFDQYCDYFNMKRNDFWAIIKFWINKEILNVTRQLKEDPH